MSAMTDRRCGTCEFWIQRAFSSYGDCDGPIPEAYSRHDREPVLKNEGTDCPAWKEKTDAV